MVNRREKKKHPTRGSMAAEMTHPSRNTGTDADRNWRRFVLFRVLFNSRFYYPVLAVLFLDLGLSATEYTVLNFAWALAIVFTDLPAGVLADRIGRKPLVVAAACCMVLEMALLSVAPIHGGLVLLLCCLANRILSGMAEGMASGADEALVFDSLAERGRSAEWPLVLDQVMRWQGVGMIIAMIVGGAIYDPAFMERLFSSLGTNIHFLKSVTLRFPIYLNLVTALLTLWIALGLREPTVRKKHVAVDREPWPGDPAPRRADEIAEPVDGAHRRVVERRDEGGAREVRRMMLDKAGA